MPLQALFGEDAFFPVFRFDDGRIITKFFWNLTARLAFGSPPGVLRLPTDNKGRSLRPSEIDSLPKQIKEQLPPESNIRDLLDAIRKECPHEDAFE